MESLREIHKYASICLSKKEVALVNEQFNDEIDAYLELGELSGQLDGLYNQSELAELENANCVTALSSELTAKVHAEYLELFLKPFSYNETIKILEKTSCGGTQSFLRLAQDISFAFSICPVCKHKVFEEPAFAICPICYWQNDVVEDADVSLTNTNVGGKPMTLREGKENYHINCTSNGQNPTKFSLFLRKIHDLSWQRNCGYNPTK